MRKSTKSDLNRYLKELTRTELENEVKKLYTKFGQVKKYYELEFSQDTTQILQEYKDKIEKEYFPTRGFGRARNSVSRKVVLDFKKISIFQKDVIDLLLYRVEAMIRFTKAYGDIDEPFYNSLESSFDDACNMIEKEKLEKEYQHICEGLVEDASNFGWGLHEELLNSYESVFE